MLNKKLDAQGLKGFRALEGEFRQDAAESRRLQFLGMMPIAAGGWILATVYWPGIHPKPVGGWVFALLMGVPFLVFGFYFVKQSFQWYRIEQGRIQAFGTSRKMLWEEELAALERVELKLGRHRREDFLHLYWPHISHSIRLLASLRAALESRAIYVSDDESEEGETDPPAAAHESTGPSWKCKHCGEENPGNFDACWKCEQARV